MKTRNGFVSNSSSTSFCIYGINIDLAGMIEKIKATNLFSEDEIEEMEEENDFWKIEEKINMEFYQDYDNEDFYIGRSWSSIGDDQTGREFKEETETKLKEIFGEDIECYTIEEVIEG